LKISDLRFPIAGGPTNFSLSLHYRPLTENPHVTLIRTIDKLKFVGPPAI